MLLILGPPQKNDKKKERERRMSKGSRTITRKRRRRKERRRRGNGRWYRYRTKRKQGLNMTRDVAGCAGVITKDGEGAGKETTEQQSVVERWAWQDTLPAGRMW